MDSFLLDANPDRCDRLVNRQIADGEERLLLDGLAQLPALIEDLRASPDDRFDVNLALRNAGASAAIALRRGKPGIVDTAVEAMVAAYRLGDLTAEHPNDEDARLWEGVAASLWALGA